MNCKLIRRPRFFLVLLATCLVGLLGLLAAGASALPGDQPINPVSPADGASVPAVEEGLKVTYSCPTYRIAEEVEEAEEEGGGEEGEGEEAPPAPPVIITTLGGAENYGVAFSTGSALGADGRLVSTGFGEAGTAEAEVVKGTADCTSELVLPTSPNPAALYGGRVYWQAFRECEGCRSGYETGPVRSFVVVPTDEEAEISYENNVFGGYQTKIAFFGDAGLKGAKVALQRWTETSWETIAEEPGTESGENTFYVTLGAGHKLLRPIVLGASGASLPLEEKSKTVRKPKQGYAVPVGGGEWVYSLKDEREEFPLSFHVTNHGRTLSGLSAAVEAICKGPTPADRTVPTPKVTIESKSTVKEVRIAPDGSVITHFATSGATPTTVTLTGRFFNGRFSGLLTSSFLNCSGFREFEAVPAPAPKK